MCERMLAIVLSTAVVATTAVLSATSEPAAAQARGRAARSQSPPRTPDGRPDLQGTYDVATITPLERPAGLGDRLVLTNEEAAALEKYEQERQVRNDAPLQPDREAPPVGGDKSTPKSFLEVLERFGGGAVGGYNHFWLASGTRVITVNGEKRSSIIVDPPNGKVPAMKPEAQKRNAAFLAAAASPDANEGAGSGPGSAFDGPEVRPLAERCLLGFGSTSGPPTLPNYFYNNLKQIVQTPDTIMILNEMVHDARIIRIGGQHLPKNIRKWMGDSVGHWEGDTLVVETTNFTAKTQFRGSSENLRVVERFTRVDPKTLLYRFTVEDPSTWDRPWSGEYPWVATDEHLYEYACHEANYSLVNVLRGARAKEADAARKPER
jgi:hypothetical protein